MIILISILLLKKLIKSIGGNFAAPLKQGNLATKADIDNFAKTTGFVLNWKTLTKNLLQIKQHK